ncbi:MAG: hypothetical protein JSW55_09895 [Chloroflexota bacterium]|nr:MAG: hypothetical protein JSW55_09895 [Chloroflexota bacterium]
MIKRLFVPQHRYSPQFWLILGGLLNDNIGPKAIWYGGGLIGLASAASFAIMSVYYSPRKVAARKAAQSL